MRVTIDRLDYGLLLLLAGDAFLHFSDSGLPPLLSHFIWLDIAYRIIVILFGLWMTGWGVIQIFKCLILWVRG
jgi:hypothetical protein